MNITLYKNTSERERVSKTLSAPISMTGTLRGECSILRPVILCEKTQNLAQYNYMYIPDFGRYYYIEIESVNNKLWRITGKVDVLMTYAAGIKKQTAIIERQENKWNLYLRDPSFVTLNKQQVQTFKFPKSFDGKSHYVLVLSGAQK